MLTLLLSTFYLASGTKSVLTQKVAEATELPVVILGESNDAMRAVKFDYDQPTDVVRELRNTFGFNGPLETVLGFGGPGWPVTAALQSPGSLTRPIPVKLDPITVTDGKVSAQGSTTLPALAAAVGKTVELSWFFRTMPIQVSFKSASVDEVLRCAFTAFGSAAPTGDNPTLTVPPDLFRTRIIRTYDDLARTDLDPVQAMKDKLRATILRSASSKEIDDVYKSVTGTFSRSGVPNSPIYIQSYDLARAVIGSTVRGQAQLARYREIVDPRKPVSVSLLATGRLTIQLPTERGFVGVPGL
jgi:hypothetical protein